MITNLRDKLQAEGSVTFTVHAKPGAPVSLISGVLDDGTLKISLHAPPEGGKANAELIRLLADEFDVSMQQVELLSGAGDRRKLVRVRK